MRKIKGRKNYETEEGNIYNGEWDIKMQEQNGLGTMQYSWDGSIYNGYWLQGKAHGRGQLYSDHFEFNGCFEKDKFHGKGSYWLKNESYYDGDWIKDVKHGKGFEHFHSGVIYDGGYNQGKRDGLGTLTEQSGTYHGEFKNDLFHGEGSYTWMDGR